MKSFVFFGSLICVSMFVFANDIIDSPTDAAGISEQTQQAQTPQIEEEAPAKSLTPTSVMPRNRGGGPRRTLVQNNLCSSQLTFESVPEEAGRDRGATTCEMVLDDQFAKALREYIPLCAKSAAASQHWAIPTHVTVQQMGGFSDRKINTPSGKGNSWSRHSVGMALDISALVLSHGGPSYRIGLTNPSENQNFYNAFRDCWDNSMRSFMRSQGKACTCSIGHPHTHPPSNVLHNNHMHISLTCPAQPGVADC